MIDIHARAVRGRIDRWAEDGLIDAETARRLHADEDRSTGAGAPLSVIIGATALALGLLALVAANWSALPVGVRLGGHVGINLALGTGLWLGVAGGRLGTWGREVAVLLLSASTLALAAHVGQAFQLQGAIAALLAAWLVLATPFTWVLAERGLNRWTWSAGLVGVVLAGLDVHGQALAEAGLLSSVLALSVIAGCAAPLLTAGVAGLAAWGDHLRRLTQGLLVIVTTASQVAWRASDPLRDAMARSDLAPGAALACLGLAAVAWASARRGDPWPLPLAALLIASPAIAALPFLAGGANSPVVEALAVVLYWTALALAARASGVSWLQHLALAVICLRLAAVFVEAFGGLLMTGIGLAATGAVVLAGGMIVRAIVRRRRQEKTP